MSTEVLAALDELLESGGEPDDLLRAAIDLLLERTEAVWAAVAFVEPDSLVVGPEAGAPDETRRARVPIEFQESRVGELWVDGDVDRTLLEQFARRVSELVLIGWDTGGEPWSP